MISIIISLFIAFSLAPGDSGEIITLDFESQIFQNKRKLRIYLPPNYSETNQYKVLFVNDGQNAFSNGAIDNWKLDHILDSLINLKYIPPLIVVGIDNIGMAKRGFEYLPWADRYLDPPISNPMGEKYPEFLINEVIPFVQSKYNVKGGNENVGIGGFSYGALITAYTLLKNPDYFGFAIIESPSFYVNNQAILRVAQDIGENIRGKIHLGIGTNELGIIDCDEENPDNKMAVDDLLKFQSVLLEKSPEVEIQSLIVPCATHRFSQSSHRLAQALNFCLN